MTGMTLVEGPSAWVGCNVHPEDYGVELSAACHDESRCAVDELPSFPLPTILLRPSDFAMPACRDQMARCSQAQSITLDWRGRLSQPPNVS
jgi:hypothetical protein